MFSSSSFSQFLHAFFGVLKEQNAKLMQTKRSRDNGDKLFIGVLAVLVLALSFINVGTVNAQTFQWPLYPFTTAPQITQDYTCKGSTYINDGIGNCVENDKYHQAIDMIPAIGFSDGNVYAVESGTVDSVHFCAPGNTGSECNFGAGNAVIIQHGSLLYSQYAHLKQGSITVINGQTVVKGEKIGEMGDTGYVTGIHLHFEVKNNGLLWSGDRVNHPDINGYFDPWKHISSTYISPVPVKIVNSVGLYVRRGPSTSYAVFTAVEFDQRFVAFAKYEYEGDVWYRIYLPCDDISCAGWIAGIYQGTTYSLEDSMASQFEVQNTGVYGLKVRSGPSTSYDPPIDEIWDGQRFVTFENSNNWYSFYISTNSGAPNGWSYDDPVNDYLNIITSTGSEVAPLITYQNAIDKLNVLVDESFTVTVSGENIGDSTADYGGITVQVRQAYYDGVEVSESHVASGAVAYQSVWWKDYTLGTGAGDTAQYLHVEPTWYDWVAGSTKTVQVTITPHQAGTYDIYTKMYFYDGSSYPRDPSGSSPYTDHQGQGTYYVGTVTVNPSCTDSDNDAYSPEGGTCGSVDCDDNDSDNFPSNSEKCSDGRDNDCDGLIDSFDSDCGAVTYYCDNDSDGYINESVTGTCLGNGCQPGGCLTNPGNDCDDSDLYVNPVAIEGLVNEVSCSDTKDNDCDGLTDSLDSDCSAVKYYCDDDNDGYINESVTDTCLGSGCQPGGCFTNSGNDCNDSDLSVNPGEIEGLVNDGSCNDTKDNDCDDATDSDDTGCIDLSTPEPDITVIDTVGATGDLNVSFGDVTNGNSLERNVMVRNDGVGDLIIGNIAEGTPLDDPFSIQANTCSGKTLETSDSCTITIRFSPDTDAQFDDSFDIPSNDPNENPVIVNVSGTGFSEEVILDNLPSSFNLVYPTDGQADVPTSLQFIWQKSTDPEGGPLTYTLYYCTDREFLNCNTKVVASSISHENKNLFYGSVAGNWLILLVGLALIGGFKEKKEVRVGALIAMLMIGGVLLPACGDPASSKDDNTKETQAFEDTQSSDSGDSETTQPAPKSGEVGKTVSDLSTGTTYYWQVVAKDSNGGERKSEKREFTTKS